MKPPAKDWSEEADANANDARPKESETNKRTWIDILFWIPRDHRKRRPNPLNASPESDLGRHVLGEGSHARQKVKPGNPESGGEVKRRGAQTPTD